MLTFTNIMQSNYNNVQFYAFSKYTEGYKFLLFHDLRIQLKSYKIIPNDEIQDCNHCRF
jgi:hypothetical protein